MSNNDRGGAGGKPNYYRFGVLERKGVIAGFEGGQVASVACGVLVGIIAFRLLGGAVGLAFALGSIAIGGVIASVPFGGKTGEQWAPTITKWTASIVRGRRKVSSGVLLEGAESSGECAMPEMPIPGELSALCLLSTRLEGGGGEIGVIHDPRNRTLSAVLRVFSDGFPLRETEEKNQRVESWSLFLAGAAREGTALRRVQWVKRSFPDQGEAIRSYFDSNARLEMDDPASRSYDELLLSGEVNESRHETYVVVSVKDEPAKARSNSKERNFTNLVREVSSTVNQVKSCDLRVGAILTVPEIRQALCDSFAVSRQGSPSWPFACREEWDSFVSDGLHSATFWVSEWPRVEVGPDFLVPLLLKPGVRMAMSVVMEPLSPLKASKQAESAKVSRMADNELRRRGGFVSTARRSREDEVLARRERELADGHGQYRFSGYVTVSAGSPEELEDSCARVLQASAQSYLTLRRLYGEQASAFAWTLPLGRGLR